jgi:hypothetical protein
MPEVQEVFRMATQKVRPDPGFVSRQDDYRRRQHRKRKVGAIVVAAAIGVAAVVIILETRRARDTSVPITSPSVNPADAAAEEVAMGFLDAFGAFDATQALGYFTDDSDITGLTSDITPLPDGVKNPDGLRLMTDWLQASGYEQTITSCEVSTLDSDTTVVCAFDFHGIRSDEIGRGPYSGSEFTITVRDGKIVRASLYWDTEKFSPQMWEPFAQWVSTTHPKDAAAMYEDGTLSNFRLTRASILLWEKNSRRYVQHVLKPDGP